MMAIHDRHLHVLIYLCITLIWVGGKIKYIRGDLLTVSQPDVQTSKCPLVAYSAITQTHIFQYIFLIYIGMKAESVINDGINCQNGGTQLNKNTCVCPGGLFGRNCESNLARTCLFKNVHMLHL